MATEDKGGFLNLLKQNLTPTTGTCKKFSLLQEFVGALFLFFQMAVKWCSLFPVEAAPQPEYECIQEYLCGTTNFAWLEHLLLQNKNTSLFLRVHSGLFKTNCVCLFFDGCPVGKQKWKHVWVCF